MSRELLILRHAKSDWNSDGSNDFQRPLAKRGKKDAPRVGEWLYREGLVPDFVISSPAERAKQTAVKVCKSLDFKKKQIVWDDAIYAADAPELLQVLARCPAAASTVLLVGHNPGLEDLVKFLAGDEVETPDDGKLLPTAATARLEMPDDWQALERGCAQLVSVTRPRKGAP
ncbi:MAG: histidine phosphatase family protein [Chromatiaceae bacterium]|jgi:phosphohistidine phosphatase